MKSALNTPLGTLVQFMKEEAETEIKLRTGETLTGVITGVDEHANLVVRVSKGIPVSTQMPLALLYSSSVISVEEIN
ncbi:hypothetical protein NECID01_2093 [Nematocida sp. AWRm77]|nr:hypothetical protein NECID01_2093 [Nematocida sp. AWRm77]